MSVPNPPLLPLPGALPKAGTRLDLPTLAGSADALVKAAARFEVDAITSREPDLEEIFLDLYSERGVTGAERVRQDPA